MADVQQRRKWYRLQWFADEDTKEERRLILKLDLLIVPYAFLAYWTKYIDQANISKTGIYLWCDNSANAMARQCLCFWSPGRLESTGKSARSAADYVYSWGRARSATVCLSVYQVSDVMAHSVHGCCLGHFHAAAVSSYFIFGIGSVSFSRWMV